MDRKVGAAVPTSPLLLGGELGPHLIQRFMGRGLPLCQVASRSFQPFGHNRLGPKIWGCAPPLLGAKEGVGARSPSNTMLPGPRPTCVPSDILIHPTVWPQYPNVTDRQDIQTDNGPIA